MINQHSGFSKQRFLHLIYEYIFILVIILNSHLEGTNLPSDTLRILFFVLSLGIGVSFTVISFLRNYEKDAKIFKLRTQGIILLIISLLQVIYVQSFDFLTFTFSIAILNLPIYIVLTPAGFFLLVKSYMKKNEESSKMLDIRIMGIAILLASAIYHADLGFISGRSNFRDIANISMAYGLPAIIILTIALRLFISKHSLDLFLRIFNWSMISFFLSFMLVGPSLSNALPAKLNNDCSLKLLEIALDEKKVFTEYNKYANWGELVELGYINREQTMGNYIEGYSIMIFDVNPQRTDNTGFTHPASFTIVALPRNQENYHHNIRAICEDQKIRKCYDSVKNFDPTNIDLNDKEYWEF